MRKVLFFIILAIGILALNGCDKPFEEGNEAGKDTSSTDTGEGGGTSHWGEIINGQLDFGPGNEGGSGTTTITVDTPVRDGDIINGHVVALAEGSEALLISRKEWSGLPSALNTKSPDEARNIALEYDEDGLTSWDIPTKEQAEQLLFNWCDDDFQSLNQSLTKANAAPMSITDDKGSNVRYLCDDATKTFTLAENGKFLNAGTTVKTYHLRLVKAVRIICKQ